MINTDLIIDQITNQTTKEKLIILYDEWRDSPRDTNTNLGTFLTWQRNYCSPDDNAYEDYEDMLLHLLGTSHANPEEAFERQNGDISWLEDQVNKHFIIKPVYCYEHGNIMYSTAPFSCPWDSGQAGVIFASKDDIRMWFSCKLVTKNIIKKVDDMFYNEVKEFSSYANGDVYQYVILNADEEIIDNCGGFYSTDDIYKESTVKQFQSDQLKSVA